MTTRHRPAVTGRNSECVRGSLAGPPPEYLKYKCPSTQLSVASELSLSFLYEGGDARPALKFADPLHWFLKYEQSRPRIPRVKP